MKNRFLVAALTALLAGCIGEAPSNDGGLQDAGAPDDGGAGRVDGGADAGPIDGGSADGGADDAGLSDAGGADAGPTDAGVTDAGSLDSGVDDAGTADAGTLDSGVTDAGAGDAGPADAGGVDAGIPDAGATDAGAFDAGAPDAGNTDAGLVDAGTDAGVLVNCTAPGPMTTNPAAPTQPLMTGVSRTFSLNGGLPASSTTWAISPTAGVSSASGTGSSTGPVAFANAGTYSITFTATNATQPAGCINPATNAVTVQQVVGTSSPCTAPTAITVTPATSPSVSVGTTVAFIAAGGTGGSVGWSVTPSDGVAPAASTGSAASITFGRAGTYVVTFTSTNGSVPNGCNVPALSSGSTVVTVLDSCTDTAATRDDFNSGLINPALWSTTDGTGLLGIGTAPVVVDAGMIELKNRGRLTTTQRFDPTDAGIRVTAEWLIGSSDDTIEVITRSSGMPGTGGEVSSGIKCTYDVGGATVPSQRLTISGLGSATVNPDPAAALSQSMLRFNPGERVLFEMTDDGARVNCRLHRKGSLDFVSRGATTNAPVANATLVSFQNLRGTSLPVPVDRISWVDNIMIERGSIGPPTHQWLFDNDVAPMNGTALVTLTSGTSLTAAGLLGNSAALGTTAAASIDLGNTLAPLGAGDFSVAFWFKNVSTSSPNQVDLFGNRTSGGFGSGGLFLGMRLHSQPIKKMSLEMYGDMIGTGGMVTEAPVDWLDNRWHHLMMTRQGQFGRVFIDGRPAATMAANAVVNLTSSNILRLGGSWNSFSPDSFQGVYDDVRIYAGGALGQCGARLLTQSYLPLPSAPGGLSVSTQGSKFVRIQWPAATNAAWYQVFENADGTGQSYALVPGDVTGTTADITLGSHLSASLQRRYFVRACNASGCGPISAPLLVNISSGTWQQQVLFKQPSPAAGDRFGYSVALSADGKTMAVGAELFDGTPAVGDSGGVFIFSRASGSWVATGVITAPTRAPAALFGSSVALSADGQLLVVGAQGDASRPGDAFVYAFDSTTNVWVNSATLGFRNRAAGDLFGQTVAVSADGLFIAVASPTAQMVEVFNSLTGNWSAQSAAVSAPATLSGDQYATSLALSADGSTLAVGAPGRDAQEGAVWVYRGTGFGWVASPAVKASNRQQGDRFGASVALAADGRTLIVGAPRASPSSFQSAGAAYVLQATSNGWAERTIATAPNLATSGWFGERVAVSADGQVFAVSSPNEGFGGRGINPTAFGTLGGSGAVYVFARAPVTTTYLKAFNADANDQFGLLGLALSGDGRTLSVGGFGESSTAGGIGGTGNDNGSLASGAVYVY